MSKISTVNILGVNVSSCNIDELHNLILTTIRENSKELFLNVNIYALNLASGQPWLREFFNSAFLVFCDGYGVKLGAKILGFDIPERITYADWMWKLAGFAAANQLSLFFLGARPGTAEKAAMRIKDRFPSLRVIGCQDGYFDKSPRHPQNEAVITKINQLHPDILLVGFGMPLQERWLQENWEKIDAHVALTGGAVFDYISGDLRRAPRWMTDHGLEWLGRLVIEPGRLWKRYILGNPLFIFRVLLQLTGLRKYTL